MVTKAFKGLACLIVLALAGCSSTPKLKENPYALQVQLYREAAAQDKLKTEQLVQAISSCESDLCRVAMTNSIVGSGHGSDDKPNMPAYVEQPSLGRQVLLSLTNNLLGFGNLLVLDQANKRSSRTQRNAQDNNRDIILGITRSVAENAGDRINIDGGFINGSASGTNSGIGNTLTADNGSIIGDGNTVDQSQGQVNGDNNFNSGRQDSPDTTTLFDLSTGSCQGGNAAPGAPGGAGGAGDMLPGGFGGTGGDGAPGGTGGDCSITVPGSGG